MKAKIKLFIALILFSTVGIAIFQVNWLKYSYEISKEKIRVDVANILDQSIVKHKQLVAEKVRTLLIKAIRPIDIETAVHYKFPDSLDVTLSYRTKRNLNGSWISFKVNKEDLEKIKRNPYPLLLKRIRTDQLEYLDNIYSCFVGMVDYKPNSREEKLQDSLMRCFYLYEDPASLRKLIKARIEILEPSAICSVSYFKGLDEFYNKKPTIKSRIEDNGLKVIEVPIVPKKGMILTAKRDSLNAYIKKLNQSGNVIYTHKIILDNKTSLFLDEMPILLLTVKVPPSYLLNHMLFSILGSSILLVLLGFSLIYMLHTILEQKKLAEIKDDFIGNVSHELKTPVATTLAAIQGMQHFDVLKDKEKTKQYLHTAANEMKRLSQMIDTILNSVIYESSVFNIKPVEFNLKEMLVEMINVQQLHAKKKVSIHLDYPANEQVFADQTHLRNVFANLIDNAIKYGNESVVIDISCIKTDSGLKIKISDNGIGIPTGSQKNIFDKFFRVPTPNDHSVKGYGLGLNYVKNIIEKHNGTVSLIKSDVNGSVFEINLPQ